MKRRQVVAAFSVAALATAMVALPAVPAGATAPGTDIVGGSDHPSDNASETRVEQVENIQAAVQIEFDPRALHIEATDAFAEHLIHSPDGSVSSDQDIAFEVERSASTDGSIGTQQIGDYTCVVEGNPGQGFHVLSPFDATGEGNSWFLSYTYHPYLQLDARQVSGRWTDQLEICATGGGHTWNGWRQNFQGTGVLLGTSENYRIGNSWGQGVAPNSGIVEAGLNFQLSAGVLGIGGSVTVQPSSDTYSGNLGPESRIGDVNAAWNVNRVNAFYTAPSNFIWDGSPDFQGNVANVLYEWYWDEPPNADMWGLPGLQVHCGRSAGLCGDLN